MSFAQSQIVATPSRQLNLPLKDSLQWQYYAQMCCAETRVRDYTEDRADVEITIRDLNMVHSAAKGLRPSV
jgi:hypothetical protein